MSGRPFLDFLWKNWHWDTFSHSEYFSLTLSVHIHSSFLSASHNDAVSCLVCYILRYGWNNNNSVELVELSDRKYSKHL